MRSQCRVPIVLLLAVSLIIVGAYAADWTSEDIGTAGGSDEYDARTGQWTINADGVDIWGSSDGFRFIYQEVSGDFEISCQVLSIENTDGLQKAGLWGAPALKAPQLMLFRLCQ